MSEQSSDARIGFPVVLQILTAIATTQSVLAKQEIIAKNSDNTLFQKVVEYALDPYKTFKMQETITPKDVEYNTDIGSIFDLLDEFTHKPALTKFEKKEFREFISYAGHATADIVSRILNKDLRINAGVKTFKKASPIFDFLPEHNPMKGGDNLQKFYAQAGGRANICWSVKLDGTRTWAIISESLIFYLSSNGHVLRNFHCFDDLLRGTFTKFKKLANDFSLRAGTKINTDRLILDGEVVNINGDFSNHMSQFRRLNNMDPSGFRFRVFDIVLDDIAFSQRYNLLQHIGLAEWQEYDAEADMYDQWENIDHEHLVAYLPHYQLERSPYALTKQMVAAGYEGIMLKTWNHTYERKRSNNWCKVKIFYTEDLPVIGTIKGTGKYKSTLGALVVDRNGVKVEVGSGFTDAERAEFWYAPPRMIEVKYQETTKDGSLRFPIFVRVRDDKDPQ